MSLKRRKIVGYDHETGAGLQKNHAAIVPMFSAGHRHDIRLHPRDDKLLEDGLVLGLADRLSLQLAASVPGAFPSMMGLRVLLGT